MSPLNKSLIIILMFLPQTLLAATTCEKEDEAKRIVDESPRRVIGKDRKGTVLFEGHFPNRKSEEVFNKQFSLEAYKLPVETYITYFEDSTILGKTSLDSSVRYWRDGKIRSSIKFNKSGGFKLTRRWYSDGSPDFYFSNDSGKWEKTGRIKSWDMNGKLTEDAYYKNGTLLKSYLK